MSGHEVNEWYYQLEGRRIGPIALQSMKDALKVGVITLQSRVWKNEFGQEWKQVCDTEIVVEKQGNQPVESALPLEKRENTQKGIDQAEPDMNGAAAIAWYYVQRSSIVGPHDTSTMRRLYNSKEIESDTRVWREGMPSWKCLSETELTAFVPPNVPPPSQITEKLEALFLPAPAETVLGRPSPIMGRMIDWNRALSLAFLLPFILVIVLPATLQGNHLVAFGLALAGLGGSVSGIVANFRGYVIDTQSDSLVFPTLFFSRRVSLSQIADANCETLDPLRMPDFDYEGRKTRDIVLPRFAVNISGEFGSRQFTFWSRKRRDHFLSLLSRAAPTCAITRSAIL